MGIDTAEQAVADAGPLIHLNEIDSLSLLRVFDEVHISHVVLAETTMPKRVDPKRLATLGHLRNHQVTISDVERFVAEKNLAHLHLGERTSFYLADGLKIGIVLTDDLAVREAAKVLGLRPVGSLGVIARACASDLLGVESAVNRMRDLQERSTLFVTPQIVEFAIETLYRQLDRLR